MVLKNWLNFKPMDVRGKKEESIKDSQISSQNERPWKSALGER